MGFRVKELGVRARRVHVPNNWVLWSWVVVIVIQAWGKYMSVGYLDP